MFRSILLAFFYVFNFLAYIFIPIQLPVNQLAQPVPNEQLSKLNFYDTDFQSIQNTFSDFFIYLNLDDMYVYDGSQFVSYTPTGNIATDNLYDYYRSVDSDFFDDTHRPFFHFVNFTQLTSNPFEPLINVSRSVKSRYYVYLTKMVDILQREYYVVTNVNADDIIGSPENHNPFTSSLSEYLAYQTIKSTLCLGYVEGYNVSGDLGFVGNILNSIVEFFVRLNPLITFNSPLYAVLLASLGYCFMILLLVKGLKMLIGLWT